MIFDIREEDSVRRDPGRSDERSKLGNAATNSQKRRNSSRIALRFERCSDHHRSAASIASGRPLSASPSRLDDQGFRQLATAGEVCYRRRYGQLELFSQRTFTEETERITGGAAGWQDPPEIRLQKLTSDGFLVIRQSHLLA
jgi:hypothetical protein